MHQRYQLACHLACPTMINRDKPDIWKEDIQKSVKYYNDWFLHFAPKTYQDSRMRASETVSKVFRDTELLRAITPDYLKKNPKSVAVLRMSTCPPMARDRLKGIAEIGCGSLITNMENENKPHITKSKTTEKDLINICKTIESLLDQELLPWLKSGEKPTDNELLQASIVISDRLCGSISDPILRNEQERRQLSNISEWLKQRGYEDKTGELSFDTLNAWDFLLRSNIPVIEGEDSEKKVNITADVVIQPLNKLDFPLIIEAKSAGDYTNVNKRRKEEAQKINQMRRTYGNNANLTLFLCGYFDTGYLGYEAAEGIDWVWEHRIDDMEKMGL